MRVAYADPPYPGQAKRLYGKHPDYAGEVNHRELIDRLEREFPDGWALSTGSKMLQSVIALCPPVRVLVWIKPDAPPMGDGFHYGWEPVLLRGCRRPSPVIRDWISAVTEGYTFRPRPPEHVIGQKPQAFCRWLFSAMGLGLEDELIDLFPGSGAVGREWESWRSQLKIPV